MVLVKDQYSSRYDALRSGDLPFNPAFAAGSLMDLGIYPIALAVHLFGTPRDVLATGTVLDSGVDGQGTVQLRYEGFDVLCLHSKVAPCGIDSEIAGESGVLVLDDSSVPTRVHLRARDGSVSDLARPQSAHDMRYEVEHFVALVGSQECESPVNTLDRSMAVMGILDRAREQVGVSFPADG